MKSKGKSIYRWIGEFVLVFASVLGAFWIEDYRHNTQEENDYTDALFNAREAMYSDYHTFKYQSDSNGQVYNNSILIKKNIIRLKSRNTDSLIQFIIDYDADQVGLWGVDWRRKSEVVESLYAYNKYLKKDNILFDIYHYEQRHYIDDLINQQIISTREEIEKILIDLNRIDLKDQMNLSIVNSNRLVNQLVVLNKLYEELMYLDKVAQNVFSDVIKKIDERLLEKGIDKEQLPTQGFYL